MKLVIVCLMVPFRLFLSDWFVLVYTAEELTLVTAVGRRFGAVACGVGQELYVFGGVRSKDADNPESSQMTICKSEFFHDELKRRVVFF